MDVVVGLIVLMGAGYGAYIGIKYFRAHYTIVKKPILPSP